MSKLPDPPHPPDSLQFAYTLHIEEARSRRKEIMILSLSTLLGLLVLTSLTIGYRDAQDKRSRLDQDIDELKKLIDASPAIKQVNMNQFAWLTPAANESVRELLPSLGEPDIQSGSPKLKDLDKEGILDGTSTKPSALVNDLAETIRLQKSYSDFKWGEFRAIPEKKIELPFMTQTTPAPSAQLLSLQRRYGLGVQIDDLLDHDSVGPIIGACFDSIMSIRTRNNAVLGPFERLLQIDKKILDVPLAALSSNIQATRAAYEELTSFLGILDPESELFILVNGEPKSEKTSFGTVYSRLLSKASLRLAELETKFTARVYDIPIQFPVTPVVLLVPLVMPLYALALILLRRAQRYRIMAAADIEKSLVPTISSTQEFHPLSAKSNNIALLISKRFQSSARGLASLGTLQYGALQIGIVMLYFYLLTAAFELSFSVTILPSNSAFVLLYSVVIVVIHFVAIGFALLSRRYLQIQNLV